MVKFGRHLQFFLECEPPKDSKETLYIVPYNQLRDSLIHSHATDEFTNFETIWRKELDKATSEFTKAMHECWNTVFDSIQNISHARGANLETALRIYTPTEGTEASQDLLSFLKRIHSVAVLNSEGLRKLVKKFDKQHQKEEELGLGSGGGGGGQVDDLEQYQKEINYSNLLLPELYSSNMYVGQATLEMAIDTLREMLEDDDYDDDEGGVPNEEVEELGKANAFHRMQREEEEGTRYAVVRHGTTTNGYNPISRRRNKDESPDSQEEEMIVSRRADEMLWLREMITLMPKEHIEHVVAHRGFHYPEKSQRTDSRPLENSIFAFEAAWSHGISLCECDVALTKDEKLVLAHDNDFTRLALNPSSNVSRTKVSDLTYKQLIALTLKNGVRAPLLFDVLRSAHEIGEHAKLIIEIKVNPSSFSQMS